MVVKRFLKKLTQSADAQEAVVPKKTPAREIKTVPFQRTLTAEGWKRLMMKKLKKPSGK